MVSRGAEGVIRVVINVKYRVIINSMQLSKGSNSGVAVNAADVLTLKLILLLGCASTHGAWSFTTGYVNSFDLSSNGCWFCVFYVVAIIL